VSSSQLRLTKTGVWLAPNNRVSTRVSTGRGVDVDAGGARSPLLTPQSTGEAEEQSPEPQREDEAAAEERGADDATAERQVRRVRVRVRVTNPAPNTLSPKTLANPTNPATGHIRMHYPIHLQGDRQATAEHAAVLTPTLTLALNR